MKTPRHADIMCFAFCKTLVFKFVVLFPDYLLVGCIMGRDDLVVIAGGPTPDSIPNSEVKSLSADGTLS